MPGWMGRRACARQRWRLPRRLVRRGRMVVAVLLHCCFVVGCPCFDFVVAAVVAAVVAVDPAA